MDQTDKMVDAGFGGVLRRAACGVVLAWVVGASVARCQPPQTLTGMNFEVRQSAQSLEMIVKSSRILTIDGRIPRFQVHNEELITATPVAENQIQLFANAPGSTQINLWDTDDRHYTIDVTVIADARMVEGVLTSQLPLASLRVTPLAGEGAIITGTVTSIDDVDLAMAIVEQFYTTVINNIRVVGVQQVLLHTKIMEVSRTKLRDLGIDWQVDAFSTTPGDLISKGFQQSVNSGEFRGLLAAMRRDNLVKLLAEPTVVATHGRTARFSVGGRVPYLIPSGPGVVTVEYEEYGTSVDFLPFVVGPGRIRLEVRPEVSEPDPTRGIIAPGSGLNVTAFTNRYVETAVEMQSGQTFAIAGLLQARVESEAERIPLLGEIPYAGALFRRMKERRNEVELLITVTPEFVEALDPHEVPCGGPGLSSTYPSDHELFLKGYLEVPNLHGDCHGMLGSDGASCDRDRDPHRGELIYPEPAGTELGNGVTIMAPDGL